MMAFLRKGKKMLLALNTGDSFLLPIIIEKREILMVVQRTSERAFTFVVINTDAQNGLEYVKLQKRFCCCAELDRVMTPPFTLNT